MVSLLEASKTLAEIQGETENEWCVENTDSFFTILGDLREKNN
ncbi:MAG: hypothetical protein ACJA2N_001872 [Salibacteraceae bacterium]|jgi:hypothetical protein